MTKMQVEDLKQCRRVERLREMDVRNGLDKTLRQELYRLERGDAGEAYVMSCIEEFGDEDWHVLTNLWLDYYGKFECDLVLITAKQIYIFEIKNYDGHFEFRNSQCSLNGNKIGANPISQAQKAAILLQNLIDSAHLDIEVKSALIFTGEHSHVDIHSNVADMDILMRHQLRDYIFAILEIEKHIDKPKIDMNKIMRLFNKFATADPIVHKSPSNELLDSLTIGIRCGHCGSNKVTIRNAYVSCKCGFFEPQERSFVRTVCEYGVLYDCDFYVTSDIHRFLNGVFSTKTVITKLSTYFRRIGYGRGTKYMRDYPTFEKFIAQRPFPNRGYYLL